MWGVLRIHPELNSNLSNTRNIHDRWLGGRLCKDHKIQTFPPFFAIHGGRLSGTHSFAIPGAPAPVCKACCAVHMIFCLLFLHWLEYYWRCPCASGYCAAYFTPSFPPYTSCPVLGLSHIHPCLLHMPGFHHSPHFIQTLWCSIHCAQHRKQYCGSFVPVSVLFAALPTCLHFLQKSLNNHRFIKLRTGVETIALNTGLSRT